MSTFIEIGLILTYILTFTIGQLWLKLAMNSHDEVELDGGEAARRTPIWAKFRTPVLFGLGIICMAISFFVSIGLLQKLDLSYLFPFQGLSVIFVTLGSFIFLKERPSIALMIGAGFIATGVVLVSYS